MARVINAADVATAIPSIANVTFPGGGALVSNTTIQAVLNALMASLPTSLPGSAGVMWNNGGMLSVS